MITGISATQSSTATNTTAAKTDGSDFAATLAAEDDTMQSSASADTTAPTPLLRTPGGVASLFATPAEEQSFSDEVTKRLNAAGVDTSQSISFSVGSDGHVRANAGTKDADKIDAVFANDPALENEYVKISDTEIGNTIASQMMAYMKTNSNGNDAISNSYYGTVSNIEKEAGEITLSDGKMHVACADFKV